MRVLTGDIGGTKTALAIYEVGEGSPRLLRSARYPSASAPGLWPLLERFFAEGPGDERDALAAAAFAVAGVVLDGRCKTTNLPWELDERELGRQLGVATQLLNDFKGVALGVTALPDDQLEWLQAGEREPSGVIAVLGAGTGLGEAILVPLPDGPRVLASEGGHADFAPRDDLEIDLLRFLLTRHCRVSYERVLSGRGLAALYDFLCAREPASELASTRARLTREDPAAVVGALGVAGEDPLCVRAVDMFAGLYGAEAGNLALKTLPTGGIYLAGGIALHLLTRLRAGFMPGFLAKGRMSPVLAKIPVAVVLDPKVGLRGAAIAALALTAAGATSAGASATTTAPRPDVA